MSYPDYSLFKKTSELHSGLDSVSHLNFNMIITYKKNWQPLLQ